MKKVFYGLYLLAVSAIAAAFPFLRTLTQIPQVWLTALWPILFGALCAVLLMLKSRSAVFDWIFAMANIAFSLYMFSTGLYSGMLIYSLLLIGVMTILLLVDGVKPKKEFVESK